MRGDVNDAQVSGCQQHGIVFCVCIPGKNLGVAVKIMSGEMERFFVNRPGHDSGCAAGFCEINAVHDIGKRRVAACGAELSGM